MAIHRIKASALIEVIVSLVLITLAVGMLMTIHLKLLASNEGERKWRAVSLLNIEKEIIKNRKILLIDATESIDDLYIKRIFKTDSRSKDIVVCELSVGIEPTGRVLAQHCFMINIK